MKKFRIITIMTLCILMMSVCLYVYAQDDTVHFDISYTGTFKVNEEKDAIITLAGDNTPLHQNVRVKIDISGPTNPTILATDSLGNQLNIAEIGYWGPVSGFPIQGTFNNETPVKVTFTESGNYTITLSLLDVANGNDVLTQKALTINVEPEQQVTTNEISNQIINNTITELPKTGTGLIEYIFYITTASVIIYICYTIKKRKV